MRSTLRTATTASLGLRGVFSRERFLTGIGVMIFAGAIALTVPGAAARQDSTGQQPPSLGELARRLRSENKPAAQSAKVWTNDNIPANPFAISIVGPPPPPPAPETTPASDAGTTPGATKPQTKLEADLAKAQEALATKEKEVDLAKRDLTLQTQAFYTNPLASQDAVGQAKLTDAQTQIDAMQVEVDKLKAQVAELQEKVDAEKKASPTPPSDSSSSSSGN